MSTINKSDSDPFLPYRHLTFHYLGYYLLDFFHTHNMKKCHIDSDADFGGETLNKLLKGQDMHLNCYLRLLTVFESYCRDMNEFLDFIIGFIERAVVEIWVLWELEPVGWMKEVWGRMIGEEEKGRSISNDKHCIVYHN